MRCFYEKACKKAGITAEVYKPLKTRLFPKRWVVSVREPFKRPEHVLEYLARYTHRVAIANSRIKSVKDDRLTFSAKNRKKNHTELIQALGWYNSIGQLRPEKVN